MKQKKPLSILLSALLVLHLFACASPQAAEVPETHPVQTEAQPTQPLTQPTQPVTQPAEGILRPVAETQPPASGRSEAPGDATGFVVLADAVSDVILEVRYYSTYNFVGDRIDGYEEPTILITREAAEALKAVSGEAMDMGYRLKVFDAYRPQMAVDHFVRWAADTEDVRMKSYFYPDLEKNQLFPNYIATRSGHSRGSTVDLTLFDMETGREVDMGGPFDYFGQLSHGNYTGITEEQYGNRMLLQELMVRHGFRPLASEWWHFTLENEPYPDLYFTFPVCEASVYTG